MLKVNKAHISMIVQRSQTYRLLCLIFMVFVVLYPIADSALDACSDHLTHSSRMLPEERIQAGHDIHHFMISCIQQAQAISAIMDGLFYHAFAAITMPATHIKASQAFPLLSSGLSPPIL